ncbi:cupin domain-containing protein [Empedobacter brevis]|uniref:phosphomannose isomerase type II C-terminal cupin domain n=1 Tax=Empedobacter brevis TaxID=247 RepID=UPI00123D74EF|nr:phosphomannose isomerase type II C-terminal cupin domain [Empedobacter brevis]QES91954.1 cupin domain-containing protein [Empedobacter brevis]
MEIGNRPWGSYYVLEDTDIYKVKRIEVNVGGRLSYQYHNHRAEVWTIVQGKALVTLDNVEYEYNTGEVVIIPLKAKHRIQNTGNDTLIFIEVQHGTYFGEEDIVRIDDDYNRSSDD